MYILSCTVIFMYVWYGLHALIWSSHSVSNISALLCLSLCFSFLVCFFFFACVDPFTSSDVVDDSIPNLNPFLTNPVVDAVHLPVVSSDGLSFSSRTPSHEMFGGKQHLYVYYSGCFYNFAVFSVGKLVLFHCSASACVALP